MCIDLTCGVTPEHHFMLMLNHKSLALKFFESYTKITLNIEQTQTVQE